MSLDLARSRHQAGDFAAAEPIYERILAADPDHSEALFLSGMLAIQTGRAAFGATRLRRATTLAPTHAKAHNALGVALSALGDTAAAIAAFRTAWSLDSDLLDSAHNLARLLAAAGEAEEAERLLRQVVEHRPGDAVALSDLGHLLHSTRPREAEAAFRRAAALAPRLPEPVRNLATILKTEGRDDEARTMAATMEDPLARFMLATTTPAIVAESECLDRVEADYLAALDRVALAAPVSDPLAAFGALGHFYFAYYNRPLKAIHQATASTYRRLCPSLVHLAPHCRRPVRPRARPRVAFVSAHWRDHTIHRLFAGLVTGLAERFEVIAIATPGRDDDAIAALRRRIGFLRLPADLAKARQQLGELEADALVYLDIGMEPFSYFLAHARLAPLQLTTWGHPVTPGLDTIDGFLSAEGLDPPGAEDDHTETLHRLAAPAFFFDRPDIPRRGRTHFGLPETATLYVCPQTLFKLHPEFDRQIGAILDGDSQGRLVLLAGNLPSAKAALETRFARHLGGLTERISFLPALPRADFLGLLGCCDVMLDIPSFSGGNTTLEALAAGLPVITLPGAHLRSRLTAGLLTLAGLEQSIAASPEEYCRLAIDTAHDGSALRAAIAAQAGMLYRRDQAIVDVANQLDRLIHGNRP